MEATVEEVEKIVLPDENVSMRRPRSRLWQFCGRRLPRMEIVYFCQILIIYVIILTSLINLSLKNGPINLWIALLGSCLGYLLPHPAMDRNIRDK